MVKIKNIEEIYKRHSDQNLETPSPAVWDRIETSLNAAKSRRMVPWLWRTAGAAAVFIGLISLGLFFFNQSGQDNTTHFSAQTAQPSTSNQNEPAVTDNQTNATVESIGPDQPAYENKTLLTVATQPTPDLVTILEPDNQQVQRPVSKATTQQLAYAPDKPIFASKKIKIKKLFENQSLEEWKEKYNVSNRFFDEQEAFSAASHKRKMHIGGAVSPIYSFRQTSGGSNMPSVATMASDSEKGLMSTGGGIHVNIEMGKNWGIESGVRYARLGQEVHANIESSRVYAMNTDKESYGTASLKTISLQNSLGEIKQPQASQSPQYAERAFASSNNTLLVDIRNDETVTNGELEQYIDYIEIPFTFRYYLINTSTKLSLAAGVSTNWLVANNAYLNESGNRQKIGETSGLSAMNFSTHAGFAFSIPLFGPLSFRIEPRLNYFINEINQNHPVKYKPYSVGIYSGIQYTIGE